MTCTRPRILISNDDGIQAPGLRALVTALVKTNLFEVFVCAPQGERSAQSHAITLGRYLACAPTDLPGTAAAYAVDGTPADSVMLALQSDVLGTHGEFDLIVSGINRGENLGLHVVYSGTVGAAEEGACKGLPAIALSLDNHQARRVDDYATAATLAVSVIKAALGLLPNQQPDDPPARALTGSILNVNFPAQTQTMQGLHLTHQSTACSFPRFMEVQEPVGPHLQEIDEHTPSGQRIFRNYAGDTQRDDAEGGDAWAVRRGWVSVCPLGIRQDLISHAPPNGYGALPINGAHTKHQLWLDNAMKAVANIITAAAADAGLPAAGISKL